MPIAPGTRLGPYEVQSAIGAGGMGQVYKARDTRLDRSVAIKAVISGQWSVAVGGQWSVVRRSKRETQNGRLACSLEQGTIEGRAREKAVTSWVL